MRRIDWSIACGKSTAASSTTTMTLPQKRVSIRQSLSAPPALSFTSDNRTVTHAIFGLNRPKTIRTRRSM